MNRFIGLLVLGFVLASCGTPEAADSNAAAPSQPSDTSHTAPTSLPTQSLLTSGEPYPAPDLSLPATEAPDDQRDMNLMPQPEPRWPTATPPPPVPDAPRLSTLAPPQATEPLTRFAVVKGMYNLPTGYFTNSLAWVDLETGAETIITTLPDGPPPHAVISPDHQYVAYAQSSSNGKHHKFYVHYLGSDDHVLLSDRPRIGYTPLTQEIFWSPDSQWVLFLHFGDQGADIRIYNPHHQDDVTLATYGAIQLHGWLDSETILFSLPHNLIKNPELWTLNYLTGEQQKVATYLHKGMQYQLLSPNKRWLYVAYEDVHTQQDASLIYDLETATWIELDQWYGDHVMWTTTSQLVHYPITLGETLEIWTDPSISTKRSIKIQAPPSTAANSLFEAHVSPDGHWLLFLGNPRTDDPLTDWYTYGLYNIATDQWHVLNADKHSFLYRIAGW